MTAFYQIPDKEEYYDTGTNNFFVVSYYNDTPDLVNWRFEDKEGVNDADTYSIDKVRQVIKQRNYKLVKEVRKEIE